jgi:hypothetical protein
MKLATITLFVVFIFLAHCNAANADCSSLRVGTKKGATDVMLDGESTWAYKQFRRIKDDNDVEVNSDGDFTTFYVSGIKLQNTLEASTHIARERLMTVATEVTSDGSDNSEFKVKLKYSCTSDLSGVSDVHVTFTLDGNTCDSNVVGLRKKCGSKYAYAPIEISETSYWGLKKNVLTDNGGATNHPDNLFDSEHENVVVKKGSKELKFRVKNMAGANSGRSETIEMDPPFVRVENEAEMVVYPVLRGAGARQHSLEPGEYTDFKLEFNCVSLDTATETVEVVFRPSFHSNYVFRVTKECEGLTVSGLIKKEFQDSVIFDFFAFMFISSVILALIFLLFVSYVKYRELKGEDVNLNKVLQNMNENIKNFFSGAREKLGKSGFTPENGTQLEMDDVEENNMIPDSEFDPDSILKTNSKKPRRDEEDDFKGDIQVQFDRDDDNFQTHELKDIEKEGKKGLNAYGTL